MKIVHSGGFTPEEVKSYTSNVQQNIYDMVDQLLKTASTLGFEVEEKNRAYAERMQQSRFFEPEGREALRRLAHDTAVQQAYLSVHNRGDLFDSAPYFWEHVDRMLADGYEPNVDDILRCRAATTGIVQIPFIINDSPFVFYDVGGQKNERRKWIHCFDKVTALLYVANLNDYNQTLTEDSTKNRLEDSLALFEAVVNLRWFERTAVVVFLNKEDLFKEKIQHVDPGAYHPAYRGGCNYDAALKWITDEYRKRYHDKSKQIYFYVTTATNTQNIRAIWNIVVDIIVKQSLSLAGFMA